MVLFCTTSKLSQAVWRRCIFGSLWRLHRKQCKTSHALEKRHDRLDFTVDRRLLENRLKLCWMCGHDVPIDRDSGREAVSFRRSCGGVPARLQPSVQSERGEINATPVCPRLAQSSLILCWKSLNAHLACCLFTIFEVSKLCRPPSRSTNGHIWRDLKIKKER